MTSFHPRTRTRRRRRRRRERGTAPTRFVSFARGGARDGRGPADRRVRPRARGRRNAWRARWPATGELGAGDVQFPRRTSLGARREDDASASAPRGAPGLFEPRCVGTRASGGASTRSATNTRGVRRVRALGRLYTLTCISSASDASRRVSRTTRDDEGAVGTSDDARPAEGSTASPPTGLRAALRSAERHIAPKANDESPATGSPAPSRRGPGAVTEGTDEIYTDFNGEKRFRRRARTTRKPVNFLRVSDPRGSERENEGLTRFGKRARTIFGRVLHHLTKRPASHDVTQPRPRMCYKTTCSTCKSPPGEGEACTSSKPSRACPLRTAARASDAPRCPRAR